MRGSLVTIDKKWIGEKIAKDIYNDRGVLVVSEGKILTEKLYKMIREYRIGSIHIAFSNGEEGYCENTYKTVKKTYIDGVENIKDVINEISKNGKINQEKIMDLKDSINLNSNQFGYFIDCINELKQSDEYTFNHSINVAIYSMLISSWMNLSQEHIENAILAGILHDVGKAKVPNNILNKKGRLDDTEFNEMKKHSTYGYEICKNIDNINPNIPSAVLQHHEKSDGTGYPMRLKAREINPYAKILAVADVYDALTSKRVYKEKITPFDTFRKMEEIGYNHFDPNVLLTFLKNISYYYVGFKVMLNTGEIGEIAYISPKDDYKPIVKINERIIDTSKEMDYNIIEMV